MIAQPALVDVKFVQRGAEICARDGVFAAKMEGQQDHDGQVEIWGQVDAVGKSRFGHGGLILLTIRALAEMVGVQAQGQDVVGDVGGDAIALDIKGGIVLEGGSGGFGGDQFSAGAGDGVDPAVANGNDVLEMLQDLQDTEGFLLIKREATGEVLGVEWAVNLLHQQQDEGAERGIVKGFEDVVGHDQFRWVGHREDCCYPHPRPPAHYVHGTGLSHHWERGVRNEV